MEKITLKKAKLVNDDGVYYLDLTYECEDDRIRKEVNIPRVKLELEWNGNVDTDHRYSPYSIDTIHRITLVDNKYRLGKIYSSEAMDTIAYIEKILEEKVQELTLSDIEKKLGYKIKIVNDK